MFDLDKKNMKYCELYHSWPSTALVILSNYGYKVEKIIVENRRISVW